MSSKAVRKQLNSILAPEQTDSKKTPKALQAARRLKKQKKQSKSVKSESNPVVERSKAIRSLKKNAAPSSEALELMNKVLSISLKKK